MNLRHHARHALPALASLALVAAPAAAPELHASAAHVSGIVVHDAAETLRDYCHSDAGRLYLELPDGSRWELVTSATVPAISNPGDGAFHAIEPAEVASALDQLNYPLVNTASAAHADRPHEIWAEDFRALFGGAAATSAGTIENASLAYPTQIAGLDRFMASLAASAASAGSARLMAAPLARGAVSFSRFGTRAAVLDVFDAAGRRLASVEIGRAACRGRG